MTYHDPLLNHDGRGTEAQQLEIGHCPQAAGSLADHATVIALNTSPAASGFDGHLLQNGPMISKA